MDNVYLDMKKAFDKVPYWWLLWKLKHVGRLKGNILKWMKIFLQDWLMRTVIKSQLSGWTKVTNGVPQGSVLAPIMFLKYINDVVEEVSSYTNLYADDA